MVNEVEPSSLYTFSNLALHRSYRIQNTLSCFRLAKVIWWELNILFSQ